MSNITPDNKYTQMQLEHYDRYGVHWSESMRDVVVGSFDDHNNWSGYENLFNCITDLKNKVGLDFACGPGRNVIKYFNRFKRLDGTDISPVLIEKARTYADNNGCNEAKFYVCNGVDLNVIESNTYDVVMSTIALQHICVHEIRKNIFTEIYRILKPGGILTAQMGFGSPSPSTVGYYENFYEATGTNRSCDVCIESPDQLEKDFTEIGYKNFNYTITPVGPGDAHPNWIFFNVQK